MDICIYISHAITRPNNFSLVIKEGPKKYILLFTCAKYHAPVLSYNKEC